MVIDLTGDSDEDEPKDIVESVEDKVDIPRALVPNNNVNNEASPARRPLTPVVKFRIEVIDLTVIDSDNEDDEPLRLRDRRRSPRSPTPSNDCRIALWAQETRRFVGQLILNTAPRASFQVRMDSTSRLRVSGVPRIIIFCDGSSRCVPNMTFTGTNGGYGVVVRSPWDVDIGNGQGQGALSGFK